MPVADAGREVKDQRMSAPLERSVSQQSYTSAKSFRSQRSGTVRAGGSSRQRKLTSQPSSSASSIAGASDKSLTSFPSLSPESPRQERAVLNQPGRTQDGAGDGGHHAVRQRSSTDTHQRTASASIVDSLTNTTTTGSSFTLLGSSAADGAAAASSTSSRGPPPPPLFDDAVPLLSSSWVPGALHLADDAHVERLVARHGAVALVRQLAGDVAERDAQMAGLRRRADERERALRKIVLECGLSSLDLETRLRAVEQEIRENERHRIAATAAMGGGVGVSGMMSDAMTDEVFRGGLFADDGTIRAARAGVQATTEGENGKSTTKGWKDYLWGGGGTTATSKKSSAPSSVNGDTSKAQTVLRAQASGDRRTVLQADLFTPPEAEPVRDSSRASSVHSGVGAGRKTSLASLALRLVAGGGPPTRESESRGRANSANTADSMRTASASSARTNASTTKGPGVQGGPKALMAMRRTAGTPNAPVNVPSRPQAQDRREGNLGSSPSGQLSPRQESYGPVEMDTIFSTEDQPPPLSQVYNNHNPAGGEYLTDRFGFIYDQRRKKRQRQAAQMAKHVQRGSRTEMLTNGRGGLISPVVTEDDSNSKWDDAAEGRPETPSSTEEARDEAKPKRWQDYLKIATFPTELLSHTPSISIPSLEIMEGGEIPRSPGLITTEDRGFLPTATTTSATTTASAVDSETGPGPEVDRAAATLVKEDAEPVKLLLAQLCELHDSLQREKTVRWNDFLRKVRAERKREGEAAAAESRLDRATASMPETKLADGEMIGVAGLGNKGKIGRAKWNEFKNLVLGGIPVAYRAKIWSECSGATALRIPGYYEDIVNRPTDDDDPQVVSQIGADITRTLTDNIFFRKGPGVAKLREVLLAYSRRNQEVGYCQGMNLVAANLLLVTPSAEDAFWILVSMVENILPQGYFDHSLLASRADQQVLRAYVREVLPRLSQHFDDLAIDLETMTFQWFLSVFTDCLSAEALFRVWDVVLCTNNEGSTFLFQVALALLKLNETQLLTCASPASVYTYINHQMTNHAISIDGLIQASEGLRREVRREDVEARRERAVEAEREVGRQREERSALRRAQRAAAAAAATTGTASSASAAADRAVRRDKTGERELALQDPIPMEGA